jgi:hypothetical protein
MSKNWKATQRWVIPNYELVISEQREPDSNWVNGYRNRVYSAIPHFAIVNTQPATAYMYVSFKNEDGTTYLDMAYEGSLAQMASVSFNLADHPKLKIPKLKATAKTGDLLWFRNGWFDIHASTEIQVDAWINYYEKPMSAQSGYNWARQPRAQLSSFIRDDAVFPKVKAQVAPRT